MERFLHTLLAVDFFQLSHFISVSERQKEHAVSFVSKP